MCTCETRSRMTWYHSNALSLTALAFMFAVSRISVKAGLSIRSASSTQFSGETPPYPLQFSWARITPPSAAIRVNSPSRRTTSSRHASSSSVHSAVRP